jgi:hypothetical protein
MTAIYRAYGIAFIKDKYTRGNNNKLKLKVEIDPNI